MNSGYPNVVMILAGLALIAGLGYCVLAVTRRKRISDGVSLHMIGALLTIMVGTQLMNIWLGINFRTDFTLVSFIHWHTMVFAPIPFRVILYLFAALTAHFLIYATGQLVMEIRGRFVTLPTILFYASGMTVIVATIMMTWFLWSAPYAATRKVGEKQALISDALTERYLKDWLKAEPDSPHAQQLYRRFRGENTSP